MKKSVKIALFAAAFLGLAGISIGLYLFNLQDKNLQKAKPDFVIIEVTGTIESVKAGEGNITNVALKTGSELSSVICTLSPQSDPATLASGNEVKIRGVCSGFLMDVLLNNCVIIP
jgi:hypothetical protein